MLASVYSSKVDPPKLELREVETPKPGPKEVLVRLQYTGVNPIDYWIAGGRYPIDPPNHIVGSEGFGKVVEKGSEVEDIDEGDYVSIYPWIHCGECRFCRMGLENLCVNGGIVGGVVDGCYAEYICLPERNVAKTGDGDPKQFAVAGVSALTAYHLIKRIPVEDVDKALVYGASGNVGMFIVQYLSRMGVEVAAVTRREWVLDMGADHILEMDEVEGFISSWGEPDLIVNPLGGESFRDSLYLLRRRGYIVTFGGLLSMDLPLEVGPIYRKELHLIGSTGGSYEEFRAVLRHLSKGLVKAKIWRVFGLDRAEEALNSLFTRERDGKILIANTIH